MSFCIGTCPYHKDFVSESLVDVVSANIIVHIQNILINSLKVAENRFQRFDEEN